MLSFLTCTLSIYLCVLFNGIFQYQRKRKFPTHGCNMSRISLQVNSLTHSPTYLFLFSMCSYSIHVHVYGLTSHIHEASPLASLRQLLVQFGPVSMLPTLTFVAVSSRDPPSAKTTSAEEGLSTVIGPAPPCEQIDIPAS